MECISGIILPELHWSAKMGHRDLMIDIAFEVSDLSRYLDFPITVHLMQDLHAIKYLEIHNLNDLAFDP